ncbi:MAG: hypothetical protein V7744_14975 [Pseudomonadales bacterium]
MSVYENGEAALEELHSQLLAVKDEKKSLQYAADKLGAASKTIVLLSTHVKEIAKLKDAISEIDSSIKNRLSFQDQELKKLHEKITVIHQTQGDLARCDQITDVQTRLENLEKVIKLACLGGSLGIVGIIVLQFLI